MSCVHYRVTLIQLAAGALHGSDILHWDTLLKAPWAKGRWTQNYVWLRMEPKLVEQVGRCSQS